MRLLKGEVRDNKLPKSLVPVAAGDGMMTHVDEDDDHGDDDGDDDDDDAKAVAAAAGNSDAASDLGRDGVARTAYTLWKDESVPHSDAWDHLT